MKIFRTYIRLNSILVLLAFLILSQSTKSQNRVISGTVYSSIDGNPIQGVVVIAVGATNGVITDSNGEYSITIPNNFNIVRFTHLGMKTVEVPIETKRIISISMSEESLRMKEATIIGKKRPFKLKVFPAIKPFNKPSYNLIESPAFERINSDKGLVNARINKIFEDYLGFIWIATDEGLFKYNGYELKTFLPQPFNDNSLKCKEVNDIFEDSKGNLWLILGLDMGLNKFNPINNTWDYYSIFSDNLYYQEINFINESKNGTIWIGTNRGLKRYDEKENKFRQFFKSNTFPSLYNCMTEDNKGNLWIGTGNGLILISSEDNKSYRHFSIPSSQGKFKITNTINSIEEIYQDGLGNIWLYLTRQGILYKISNLDFQTFETYQYFGSISFSTTIVEDEKNNLWIGNYSNLYKYDQIQDSLFRIEKNSMISLLKGNSGQVYLVTEKGIEVLFEDVTNLKSSNHPFLKNLIVDSENWVTDVIIDKSGNFWIGTNSKGILKYNPYKLQFYGFTFPEEFRNFSGGLSNEPLNINVTVTDFFKDDQNRLWIGTENGLHRLDSSRTQFKQLIGRHYDVVKILGCVASNLYVSISHGMFLLVYNMTTEERKVIRSSSDGFTFYVDSLKWYATSHQIFNENSQISILINELRKRNYDIGDLIFEVDKFRQYWCQIGDILLRFDPKLKKLKKYEYNSLDSLGLCGPVSQILLDEEERLWVITTQGYLSEFIYTDNKFDSGYFLHHLLQIKETEGKVYSIQSEGNDFWISTENGLLLFDPHNGVKRRFYRTDGIPQIGKAYTSYLASDKEIFLGGENYFFSFYSDEILYNFNQPRMVLTEMFLNSRKVEVGENSPLTKSLQYTNRIELKYNQSNIGFEYVGLEYSDPLKNQYAYRLIGVDTNWTHAGTNRKVYFADLDPGNYIFEVKGSNHHGIWSEEPARVRIIIDPPWYQRTLAYISYCVLLFMALFGFIRWRTRSLKKDKEVLERQIKERTKQIEYQKEEIESQRDVVIRQKEKVENTLEQLKQTQNQLIQSEKMASLGGLVAGVAHEINTPVGIGVTAISNLIEETKHMADLYYKEQISRKDFKEFLQATNNTARLVQRNLERTAELVQSFKQVSVDQSTEEQRKFFLKAYLEDVIRSLYPKFKNRDIQVNIECDDNLEIRSYPGVFAQIFTNLLLNSIAHGFLDGVGGQVEILVSQDNNELSINYMDNGKGIPKDILPKIFDPFFTTDQSKGTGLGLNIVYNLVTQKLNGTIVCDSRINNGVEFKFKIPI